MSALSLLKCTLIRFSNYPSCVFSAYKVSISMSVFVYSLQTDGRIKSLEMHGIQKRYSPEKHYVSVCQTDVSCVCCNLSDHVCHCSLSLVLGYNSSIVHWVHFTVLRCICVFVFSCISLHACCIIVTRWGGPGGIEA